MVFGSGFGATPEAQSATTGGLEGVIGLKKLKGTSLIPHGKIFSITLLPFVTVDCVTQDCRNDLLDPTSFFW